MSHHPFRFGVLVSSAARSAGEWRDRVRQVERLGYDSLLLPDHLGGPELAPLPALAFAAAVTARLRLGILVANNDQRHPALLSHEAATLHLLCDHRLELGLGAGWMLEDYRARGMAPDPAPVRVARLAESVRAVKALLDGEELTHTGEYYRFEGLSLGPAPVCPPRPSITIGGGGRRVLELAAAEADVVGINPALPAGRFDAAAFRAADEDATRRKVDWVRRVATARRVAPELQIVSYFTAIGPHAREQAAGMAGGLGVEVEELVASPHALVGTVDEVAARLHARSQAMGISYICVRDRAAEAFAPVMAGLRGG